MAPQSPPGWTGLEPAPGRLLVAAPVLDDPSFVRTVVYLLDHDDDGSVGVVVNRPTRTPVGSVLPAWHDVVAHPQVVYAGGPVQPDGALCIGELSRDGIGVRPIADGLCTVDLDAEVGQITTLTTRLRVFAGHAGWGAGQLDGELAEGAWFVVESLRSDVFAEEPARTWSTVLGRQPLPLRLLASYPPDPVLN